MEDYASDELIEKFTPEQGVEAINQYFDNYENQVSQDTQGTQEQDYTGSEPEQQSVPTSTDPQQQGDSYQDQSSLFQPFKAGGKEVQVRNLDEARSLMQKGVDYTQKMQALKPRIAQLRTLEQANMLGDNMDFAIDLFNGRPEAVAKLIKDKGIDVNTLFPKNEFGEETEQKPYVPESHRISDERVRFLDVVDELKANNSLDKVTNAITSWDFSSKDEFTKDPEKLLALSNHIQSGLYDAIMKELEHARMVDSPYIKGKTDFEAYTAIGNAIMQAQLQQQQQAYQQPQQNVPQQPSVQQAQRQLVQDRKASALAPRANTTPTHGRFDNFDPLALSDEEISKISINDLFRGY